MAERGENLGGAETSVCRRKLCLRAALIRVRRIKQLNKGYYTDVAKIIHPGHMGKTWIAPEVLIREDVRVVSLCFFSPLTSW